MKGVSEAQYVCGLRKEDFECTIDGKSVSLYVLRNAHGMEVALTNYGGAVCAIMVPDCNGDYASVIQGHDNIHSLVHSPQVYLSTLIGRYANRIGNGRFSIDGKDYQLKVNCGPNCLHAGSKGWNQRVWDVEEYDEGSISLKYVSPDGEEGFPGEVTAIVTFGLSDNNELSIDYRATTSENTIVNLTHHGFFCLQGMQGVLPSVTDQMCEINADRYLPCDEYSLPTGEVRTVADSPFDFRKPKRIGQDIDADDEQTRRGGGYDHYLVLNKEKEGELSFAARVMEEKSGRVMEVYTTAPGLMFYTDNHGDEDSFEAYHGILCTRRSAVCFECHGYPDAINNPDFPSDVLHKGEEYNQRTVYRFLS